MLAKRCNETTAVVQKKYNKKVETLHAKQNFSLHMRQVAKIYVATSHNVVWLETIEISKQRAAFIWCFAQEVDWCLKDCDKQCLQTTVSINLWKIFVGHTGDWLDVRTASICTTDLWDALKSFILNSLKFKVAPYPSVAGHLKWNETKTELYGLHTERSSENILLPEVSLPANFNVQRPCRVCCFCLLCFRPHLGFLSANMARSRHSF